MSDCNHDNHRYGGSGGGNCRTGVALNEVGDEYKEKKGKVLWECGNHMHLRYQCPVFKAKIADTRK